jgi:hypothetical protein
MRAARTGIIAAALVAAGLSAAPARALEDGASSYPRGQRDAAAGIVPTAPGLYLRDDLIFYRGSLEEPVAGGAGAIDADLDLAANTIRATFVTPWEMFGANWAINLSWLQSATDFDGRFAAPAGTTFAHERDAGIGDLALTPLLLGWHAGRLHASAGFTVWIPVGDYDAARFVNPGRHYWSLGPQAAVTWRDPATGWDLSLAALYVASFENRATDYDSGDVVHVNAYAGKQVAPWLKLGIAGYAMQQMTDDSGSGATLGGFRARLFGLGPAAHVTLDTGATPVVLTIKYYREFGVENTFEGDLLSIGTSVRF